MDRSVTFMLVGHDHRKKGLNFGKNMEHIQDTKNCKFTYTHAHVEANSNSNMTFIALNLPYSKGALRRNRTKHSQPISISRDKKEVKHHRECQG